MPPIQVLVHLSQNVAILLALTFIYGLIVPSFKRIHPILQQILQGVVFGLSGVAIMMAAIELKPGIIVDGRSIIVSIAGLFGGGIPGLIAAVLVAAFRYWLGGAGATSGAVGVFIVAGLGYGLRINLRRYHRPVTWRALLVLGFAVVGSIFLMISVFGGSKLFGVIAGPLIVLYPAGILMLGVLMAREQHQREVEEALRHSEDRYRSVIEAMSEGVVVRDMEGNVRTHNRSAEHLLGLSEDELKHGREEDLIEFMIHEDGSPVSRDSLIINLIRAGDEHQYRTVRGLYRPDGTLVWLLVSSRPLIKPGDYHPYAVVTTFTDITGRKQAEETTGRERDRLRTLIDSTPDYIFIKDPQGRFEISNTAHARAVHVEADELTGKTAFDVFPMELAAQFHYDDMAVINSGTRSSFVMTNSTLMPVCWVKRSIIQPQRY